MSPILPQSSRGRLILLVVLLAAAFLIFARAIPMQGAQERLIATVRAVGPLGFFAAMALVPVPLFWFTVPAGEAFAGQLTLWGVIGAALAAVAVQIAVCYWMARYALRPPLAALVRRCGSRVPSVTPDNAFRVALLVKLTPGPALFMQCFILGLAEVPFGLYMAVSWLCTVPWVVGGIVLGRGFFGGNLRLALAGIGLLGAAALVFSLWRRGARALS